MTTLPEWWGEDTQPDYIEPPLNEPAVVPVKVMFSETETMAAEFGGCMTWPVSQVGVGTPVQVLQRRLHRFKAQMVALFPSPGILYFNTKYDPLSNPTPQGFSVAVTGASTSNPAIVTPAVPATGIAAQNPNPYAVQVVITAGGSTITAVNVNGVEVGTGAGTYWVPAYGAISIAYSVASPAWTWTAASTATTTAGSILQLLPPYENQQPLWAIASIGGVTLSILDQAFGQVQ